MHQLSTESRASPNHRGIDHRSHPRVPLQVGVGVHSESNFYVGMSNDISEGGLFIATHQVPPVGSELEVELFLPGGVEVRALATVRWVSEPRELQDPWARPGMGVQFADLDARGHAAIAEFIENRAPLFFD